MDRVMNGIVANVATGKAGPDCRCRAAEKENEQTIKDDRQRNAHRRRHDQPFGVIRIIVVNAVDDKMKLFSNSSLWLVVKSVAMNDVLMQSPNDQSEPEEFRYR